MQAPRRVCILLATTFSLLVVAPVFAATPEVDAAASAIYADFMSPYCPGLLLADCRSDAAAALRDDIRTELANGKTDADVRTALEATFGDRVRAAPQTHGFGLWAWLTPGLFVACGGGIIALWVQRRRHRVHPAASPVPAASSPALQARLERDLRSFDAG